MEGEELNQLFTSALNVGLNRRDIKATAKLRTASSKYKQEPRSYYRSTFFVLLVAVLYGISLPKNAYKDPATYLSSRYNAWWPHQEDQCLLNMNDNVAELTRPLVDCSICRNINTVPVYENMTKEYFLKHHAYTGVPVLIKGGCKHWSAIEMFGYKYFSDLYTSENALDEFDEKECQFFGYKTNMLSLRHVFEMSKKRAALKKDQWYIGWSNCIERVQNKLRKHYSRPDFLPDDSESSALDWIFMGGSGTGAMMHIDNVNRPSWQAMIKGSKTWYIEPPAECALECPVQRFNATLEAGDILVVDTNKWFHSTFIHPVGLSITIGSEYD